MTYDEMVNWENRQWNRYSKELEEKDKEDVELPSDYDCDPDEINNPEKKSMDFSQEVLTIKDNCIIFFNDYIFSIYMDLSLLFSPRTPKAGGSFF